MKNSQNEYIIQTYRKRAANYDYTANLYYLFGYREWAYRKLAVEALKLKPGATVLELACGTGINFPIYQQYIGSEGRIIGVDITDAMLEKAQERVAHNGWENVTLIQGDATTYKNSSLVDAVISSAQRSFSSTRTSNPLLLALLVCIHCCGSHETLCSDGRMGGTASMENYPADCKKVVNRCGSGGTLFWLDLYNFW
jgi:SAM-dependent methyltransferase